MGKLIASFCALMGISFFALPAGILGSGFALKVQQQQRQKHMIRRRQPAATLIQCLWRCYAADQDSCSVATWKIHLTPLPSPPASFKHNASFVMTRWPTIRRHKSLRPPSPSPSLQTKDARSGAGLMNRVGDNSEGNPPPPAAGGCQLPVAPPRLQASASQDSVGRDENSLHDMCEEEEGTIGGRWQELTPKHKAAIRAIRKMKYLVSRRKFREALKPYDVKDVIEQYSAGHVDLLGRVKSLQGRLDMILGRAGSKARDVYDSKICLAARIVKVERQVEDIETKIEQLLDMYMEDRKRLIALFPASPPGGSPPAPPGGGGGAGTDGNAGNLLAAAPPPNALTIGGGVTTSGGKLPNEPTPNPHPIHCKLRPILLGKQSSEPNSPVTRLAFQPNPNPSDEEKGSKIIRKRVTLSSIPSRDTAPQPPPPQFLAVPDPEPSLNLILTNACAAFEPEDEEDVEQVVFQQTNEISSTNTNLGKAERNGIFDGEFSSETKEEENAV